MKIDLRADLAPLSRRLSLAEKRQLPFATAQTLTAVARLAQAAEIEALPDVFDRPTPFTVKSVAVKAARKSDLEAMVFVRPIAAQYLAPFEDGGRHFLGGKQGLLTPVGQRLNQYGNIPRTALARLKAKPGVFVGSITFRKSGQTIGGVWQRPAAGARRGARSWETGGHGTKGKTNSQVGGVRTGLKLLIRFEDPQPVKQHFGFRERAVAVIRPALKPEFKKAMAAALATAK